MDIDRSALPDLVEVEIALLDFDLADFDLADFVDAMLLFLPIHPTNDGDSHDGCDELHFSIVSKSYDDNDDKLFSGLVAQG